MLNPFHIVAPHILTNQLRQQLDPHIPDNTSSTTAKPLRKRDKFRNFLPFSKAKPKDKTLQPNITLDAPDRDSHFHDVLTESVSGHAAKPELRRLQHRIARTDQLVYCNTLLLL
ncbi:hypothetical protein BGZ96_010449 [Linnemannia gamsii]|uniref:Uncharacterized protein n=1 Tax=Linnemannia gamsii TaxID=64522 RepID=A0ABQ7JUN3_9FUNG|nr:hypothetical protein BGZ96_010449 [Linnemannia gamsii]